MSNIGVNEYRSKGLLERRRGGFMRIKMSLVMGIFVILALNPCPSVLCKEDEDLLRIHIIDVGEADSIIIQAPYNDAGKRGILIVDVGEDRNKAGNEARLIYERLKGVIKANTIDYVLLTNYNEEHIGWPSEKGPTGIFYLWDKKDLKIKRIIDRGLDIDSQSSNDNKYNAWVLREKMPREEIRFNYGLGIREKQINLHRNLHFDIIAFNSRYDRKPEDIAIADKEAQMKANENNFSIVFVLSYKNFDMYFGSDIPGYQDSSQQLFNMEKRFLDRLKKVEVYKVTDHGSNQGTRSDLLQILMPKVSIISCGRGHGNPHPQLLMKLLGYADKESNKPVGSDVYQTSMGDGWMMARPFDTTGRIHTVVKDNIIIETDGEDHFYIKYNVGDEEIKKGYDLYE